MMTEKYFLCMLCFIFVSWGFGQEETFPELEETAPEVEETFPELEEASKVEEASPKVKEVLPKEVQEALSFITPEVVIKHAKILSSNNYKGRVPGTNGSILAGNYIAQQFRKFNLLPGGDAGGYFSYFKIERDFDIDANLQVKFHNGQVQKFSFRKDFTILHMPKTKISLEGTFALVGYGISSPSLEFDEYHDINIKDKFVVIFSGVPWPRNEHNDIEVQYFDSIVYKVQNAQEHGAKGVFIVDNPIGWRKELLVEKLKSPGVLSPLKANIPVIHITNQCLSRLVKMKEKEIAALAKDIREDNRPQPIPFYEKTIKINIEVREEAFGGRNVIGILPGSDPELKKEAIVIGAHYDHLGGEEPYLCLGANDNASGTSAVLGAAQAFSLLSSAPKRTIIFIAFDAEELGLLGSEYYVNNPVIPKEDTVMMINFDMVGRNEPNHIYAVGTKSSTELHEIHHLVNQYIKLEIENPHSFRLGLSDHSNFYYANIPIMYLFGGIDVDYHSPGDTVDKLSRQKIQKASQLAFTTAWYVAQLEKRISFVEKK